MKPSEGAPDLTAVRQLAAHLFPPPMPLTIEYVPEGVSTYVYRITRGNEHFYLRVLPEAGASFAPEARAHALLRQRGASVPEVIHCEHRNEALGLSVMVTTEVPGQSLAAHGLDEQTPAILFAAGRDLALINGLPVQGFGWIVRNQPSLHALTAELPTNRAFLSEHLDSDLAILRTHLTVVAELRAIESLIAQHDGWLDAEHASLAHGDFDVTHIYAHHGIYSGIIDFGEIRGTDRWYDLGHFRLHDGESIPAPLLPWLLAGYRSAMPLPDHAEQRIAFASLLNGIRTLGRTLLRRPASPLIAHCLRAVRRDLAFLATGPA
ncbi:MAG: aminoglycoside phosphotransferase family protein [Thermomicrobiales bacterium]